MSIASDPGSARARYASRFAERGALVVLRRALLAFVVFQLAVSCIAGHRAIVQVRSVAIRAPSGELRSGDTVVVAVVASGRVPTLVMLQLIQGTRADTIGVQPVRENREPFYDPRTQHASLIVTVTDSVLARYHAGPAILRASGIGRSQFLRIPPPVVSEVRVVLP